MGFARIYFQLLKRFRWGVPALWIGVSLLGAWLGPELFARTAMDFTASPDSPSSRAVAALGKDFPILANNSETVMLIKSVHKDMSVLTDTVRNVTADVERWFWGYHVRHMPLQFVSYYSFVERGMARAGRQFVAPSNTSTIISMATNSSELERMWTFVNELDAYMKSHITPQLARVGATARLTGFGAMLRDTKQAIVSDFEHMDIYIAPFAFIVLAVAVDSLRLVTIAFLCIGVSVATALLILYGASYTISVAIFGPMIMMSCLLAFGIDYNLFLLTRFREELKRGRDPTTAVEIMLRTAGKNVFISGATVTICFGGLIMYPIDIIASIGIASTIGIGLSLFVNLSLTPALLLCWPRFFSSSGLAITRKILSKIFPALVKPPADSDAAGTASRSGAAEYGAVPSPTGEPSTQQRSEDLGAAGVDDDGNEGHVGDEYDRAEQGSHPASSDASSTHGSETQEAPEGQGGGEAVALEGAEALKFSGSTEPTAEVDPLPRAVPAADGAGLAAETDFAAKKGAGTGRTTPARSGHFAALSYGSINDRRQAGARPGPGEDTIGGSADSKAIYVSDEELGTGKENLLENSVPAESRSLAAPKSTTPLAWGVLMAKQRRSVWHKIGSCTLRWPWIVILVAVAGSCLAGFQGNRSSLVNSDAFFEDCVQLVHTMVDHVTLLNESMVNSVAAAQGEEFTYSFVQHLFLDPSFSHDTYYSEAGREYRYMWSSFVSKDNSSTVIEIQTGFNPYGLEVEGFVTELREVLDHSPHISRDCTYYLAGSSILMVDVKIALFQAFPSMIALTMSIVVVVVAIMFRSLVLPVRLIFTLVITLTWVWALAVLVFQNGLLDWLVVSWQTGDHMLWFAVPPMTFSLICGLALDYDIFVITRVHEYRESGVSDRQSILNGLYKTGWIITVAGVIMTLAFGGLMVSGMVVVQQFSFFLVIACVLDTFIVRTVVVPAVTAAFGRWNWWPSKLSDTVLGDAPADACEAGDNPKIDDGAHK